MWGMLHKGVATHLPAAATAAAGGHLARPAVPPALRLPPDLGGSVLCARRRLLAVPGSAPGSARSLDLSRNHVARLGAGDLAAWAALEELDLSENALGALEPGSFAGLGALRSLSLRCNRIAVLPSGAFAALGALRRLDLSGNRMRAVPRGAFSGLGALGSLDLSENSLLWVSQGAFEGLGALRSLSLRRAGLRALPSGALARLPALSELDASGNSLRALGPRCLRGVPRLRVLRLSGAGLRRVEPGALAGLPALRDLDLSENALDSLPERAGAPLALRALRLDGNPIACDCRLLWLRTRPSPEALLGGGEGPPCAAPPEARGARLLSAPLRCRAPRVRLRAGPVAVRAGGRRAHPVQRERGPAPQPRVEGPPGPLTPRASTRRGTRGEAREPAGTPLTPLTPLLLVSAGLGGLTFLGVVILCLLVLAAGTRSWGHKRRRRTRQRTELEYGGTRRSRGGPRSPSRAPPRHFVMRMM
ncbi:LOW QUALITY PROTEIN: leucine-rich repeat and immunoglobulin-like domain-containing nogo receptor-interacting protein 3 [Lethenteron reissneri]|uniref:LOW QUALITY PROTEIN: leucine-rich repeat and immunoglobulin-like domain-containing nogo receptor-interacting protein 3 n=1 Tax=Lethenteron reissneri TaxID=7753 RepID=UPI002AB7E723|nr:LOW QUALITY PROTEIN: leucine-rich repeat and immunoglobulin-like domain-containing nogo receptor-interacting protein 3 [Lethenteron reissneri]